MVISVFVYGDCHSLAVRESAGACRKRVGESLAYSRGFHWLLCSLRLTNTVCFGKEVLFGFCRSYLRRDHLL